jgi:NAD(P)-dependent dehydrogenase (short-subunit alcohol dehydrogenase family)
MARIAIVTGGGSGIGEAVSRALAARGDTVVVADIDGASAERVAGEIGNGATATKVDVRDAAAVQAMVDETVAAHGRLDIIFNNAGIAVGGDDLELTVAHWDRIIDINLRGVVHGIQAAYPVMARQRSGSIVNTASVAGLVPVPFLAPYVAVKHAVVGLSLSLREEARAHRVNVTVVCPSWTDTPILDSTGPDDLPKPTMLREGSAREVAEKMGKLYTPEALAQDILRGIDRKKAMVVAPRQARVIWRLTRLMPVGISRVMGFGARREQRKRLADIDSRQVDSTMGV